MRLFRAFLVLSLLLLPQMANAETLMMATTTSTQDTGLLEYLQPIFKSMYRISCIFQVKYQQLHNMWIIFRNINMHAASRPFL